MWASLTQPGACLSEKTRTTANNLETIGFFISRIFCLHRINSVSHMTRSAMQSVEFRFVGDRHHGGCGHCSASKRRAAERHFPAVVLDNRPATGKDTIHQFLNCLGQSANICRRYLAKLICLSLGRKKSILGAFHWMWSLTKLVNLCQGHREPVRRDQEARCRRDCIKQCLGAAAEEIC